MPTYEYACRACGHEWETEQHVRETPLKRCTACGAERAERLISRTAFSLSGGGWAKEGYGSTVRRP